MDSVFWATGIFTWIFFGMLGLAWAFERTTDYIIYAFWSKKEFLAFVWERLKSKRAARTGADVGGARE